MNLPNGYTWHIVFAVLCKKGKEFSPIVFHQVSFFHTIFRPQWKFWDFCGKYCR